MNIKLITKRGSVKQYSENGVKKPTQSPTKLTNVEVLEVAPSGKRQSEQRNTSWVITRLGKTIYSTEDQQERVIIPTPRDQRGIYMLAG